MKNRRILWKGQHVPYQWGVMTIRTLCDAGIMTIPWRAVVTSIMLRLRSTFLICSILDLATSWRRGAFHIQRPHRVGPRVLIVPISLSVSVMHDLSYTMRALADAARGHLYPKRRLHACVACLSVSVIHECCLWPDVRPRHVCGVSVSVTQSRPLFCRVYGSD